MSTTVSETRTALAPAAPATPQNRRAEPGTRWQGVTRPYRQEDIQRLQGTVKVEYTLASLGAERLWQLLQEEEFVPALGALTGNQAVQQVSRSLRVHGDAAPTRGWDRLFR